MSDLFEIDTINFLDIGCSGSLDDKWAELLPLLAYSGFEPNKEECDRLKQQPHPYQSVRYLPYAIADCPGDKTLYTTESLYCSSLLRPNHPWLKRFSFAHLFKETGTETVACTTLNALVDEQNLHADIIKVDTQGLEYPILKAGDRLLEQAFCVETETGFLENYVGESTYSQIDEFMRSQGFLMFDLKIHRASRKNSLSEFGKHQPLWCEAIWLYDFVGQSKQPSQEQALKALAICRSLNYFDYGLELAQYFNQLGILDSKLVSYLAKPENWMLQKQPKSKTGKLLSIFPKRIKKRLLLGIQETLEIS